jgi:ABC-type Mn2+/Zn2+ transport system permease subunit
MITSIESQVPDEIWSALADPWSQAILQRAFAEVALLGLVGGALGCWIVLYELSYAAESLAHGLFPGLVIAALTGAPLLLGGVLGLAVASLAIALVGRLPELGRDTAVAVVVTTLFGLGALLALSPASPPGIQGLLFGDVLAVTDLDLGLAAGLGAVVLCVLVAMHSRLLAVGFDRSSARQLGASATVADIALVLLVAVAVLVAVQALGNLLVVAVLVAPAASARLLTRRVAPMMAVAAAIAIASGVVGLYVSYYAAVAAGASVALVLVLTYALIAALRFIRVRLPFPTAGSRRIAVRQ